MSIHFLTAVIVSLQSGDFWTFTSKKQTLLFLICLVKLLFHCKSFLLLLQNYDNSARNKHQISQFYKSQSISEHHWHELILLSWRDNEYLSLTLYKGTAFATYLLFSLFFILKKPRNIDILRGFIQQSNHKSGSFISVWTIEAKNYCSQNQIDNGKDDFSHVFVIGWTMNTHYHHKELCLIHQQVG